MMDDIDAIWLASAKANTYFVNVAYRMSGNEPTTKREKIVFDVSPS